MGKDLCTSCRGKEAAAQQLAAEQAAEKRRREEAEAAAEAARQLEERTSSYVEQSLVHIRRALAQGLTPSLLTVETLSTTYALNGSMQGAPPDLASLSVYSVNGWEVLATIPQTEGTAFTNRLGNGGTVWAAGVGGLITGVYVLMRLPITSAYLEAHEDYVRAAIRNYYVDGASNQLLGAAFAAPVLEHGRHGNSTLANIGLGVAGGLLIADSVGGMMDVGDSGGFDDGGGSDFGGFDF